MKGVTRILPRRTHRGRHGLLIQTALGVGEAPLPFPHSIYINNMCTQ